MAAEFFPRGQRLLEVYACTFSQSAAGCAERGLADSFTGEISREAVIVDGNNREAAAVHGNAIGNGELGRKRRRVNRYAATLILHRERFDRAEMLDNPREH